MSKDAGVVTDARASAIPASWACIAHFESRDRNDPPGNGRYGQFGYWQITDESLHSIAHLPGHASDYSKATQLKAAEEIEAVQGWHAWPNTSRLCGL